MTNKQQTQHTPGPWTIAYTADNRHRIQAHDKIICWSDNPPYYKNLPEWEANSRLIAACPTMYEVLKKLKEFVDNARLTPAILKGDKNYQRIEQTIKKAEGTK